MSPVLNFFLANQMVRNPNFISPLPFLVPTVPLRVLWEGNAMTELEGEKFAREMSERKGEREQE